MQKTFKSERTIPRKLEKYGSFSTFSKPSCRVGPNYLNNSIFKKLWPNRTICIRSICDFQIIFEYPNTCHRIPNSSRIFYKQDMCRKHSKEPSCRYENKGSNFPHLIWSLNLDISIKKILGGLLIDWKYWVLPWIN